MAKVKTYKTLDEAIEKNFVQAINISDRGGTQTKGHLIFSIGEGGSVTNIRIPNTWVPVNLLEYGNLDEVKNSTSLRALMRARLLVLVTEESAKDIKNQPNFRAEYQRFMDSMKSMSDVESVLDEEIEINTGMSSTTPTEEVEKDSIESKPNKPKDETDISQVNRIKIEELVSLNSRGNVGELFEIAAKSFPYFTDIEFIYMSNKIGDQSSMLNLLCSDAISAYKGDGKVELLALPAYEEYQAANKM